jgi:hypothetical protein
MPAERTETRKRSVVKALTYRVVIVCLDFLAVYIYTHKVEGALGFRIVSNDGRLLLARAHLGAHPLGQGGGNTVVGAFHPARGRC